MILFRTEASQSMGTGHLMRCLALAEICMELGRKAIFVMNECPGALKTRVTATGAELVMINDGADATQLFALIKQLQPTGIVIDGYHFNEHYRQSLSAYGLPVVTMDDGTTQHPLHADVVVNVSPLAKTEDYITIAASARLLLGPSYVSLRSEFRHGKKSIETTPPKDQRVLITFGGSDPLGLTLPIVVALLDQLPEQVILDVVVGGAVADDDRIDQLAIHHANRILLHKNTSAMAELMQRATMAIAAAGSTLWELTYLAIPTIAVVVADNQAVMLRSPLSDWFGTIDARTDTGNAINQVAAASQALWKDSKVRADCRTVLSQIGVGEKVTAICKTFDDILERPA
jgi:UDP-2,4-diacetamido-2,4,6-trideoxy-beta-L-altropyranose hydrolase